MFLCPALRRPAASEDRVWLPLPGDSERSVKSPLWSHRSMTVTMTPLGASWGAVVRLETHSSCVDSNLLIRFLMILLNMSWSSYLRGSQPWQLHSFTASSSQLILPNETSQLCDLRLCATRDGFGAKLKSQSNSRTCRFSQVSTIRFMAVPPSHPQNVTVCCFCSLLDCCLTLVSIGPTKRQILLLCWGYIPQMCDMWSCGVILFELSSVFAQLCHDLPNSRSRKDLLFADSCAECFFNLLNLSIFYLFESLYAKATDTVWK